MILCTHYKNLSSQSILSEMRKAHQSSMSGAGSMLKDAHTNVRGNQVSSGPQVKLEEISIFSSLLPYTCLNHPHFLQ